MRQIIKLICSLAFALLVGGQLYAQTSGANPIKVEEPWARATPGGAKTGAAYLTLVNSGDSTGQLVGATTPMAEKVQFHKESEENGISRMRELLTVEIPPGAKVTFRPGEMHIMLVGLKQPLKEGQTFPLTLQFGNASKVDVVVSIAKVGAMRPGDTGAAPHGADGAGHTHK
jgi:periplasmic copper chaperone A